VNHQTDAIYLAAFPNSREPPSSEISEANGWRAPAFNEAELAGGQPT